MNKKLLTSKLTKTALFVALAVLFPQIFHIFGQTAGKMFLPMHIPVLLCGFCLGARCGLISGILAPILSCLIFQMPVAFPMMPIMVFELAAYGLFAGFFFEHFKFEVHISLLLAMILGRCFYAMAFYFITIILGYSLPAAMSVFAAIAGGLAGIALQLAVIPLIVGFLKKRKLI